MIAFMKSWCEGIIVAVIISIIIELMIPEGNNKKYVKVVIGIYILFVIIGPILDKIKKGYSLDNFFEFETIEVSAELDNDIKNVYVQGIEETIKNELIKIGYWIEKVEVKVDNNYEKIEKIEIELAENNQNIDEIKIEEIRIGESKKNEKDNQELKKYVSQNYQVDLDKIYILQN